MNDDALIKKIDSNSQILLIPRKSTNQLCVKLVKWHYRVIRPALGVPKSAESVDGGGIPSRKVEMILRCIKIWHKARDTHHLSWQIIVYLWQADPSESKVYQWPAPMGRMQQRVKLILVAKNTQQTTTKFTMHRPSLKESTGSSGGKVISGRTSRGRVRSVEPGMITSF